MSLLSRPKAVLVTTLHALVLLLSACGGDHRSTSTAAEGPTAQDTYTLSPDVKVVSRSQSDSATVGDDRIVFPRSGNEALLSLRAGTILVGDRSSSLALTNRYGFARKVARVEDGGDTIAVVTDGNAAVEEIFERAAFVQTGSMADAVVLPPIDGMILPERSAGRTELDVQTKFSGTFGKELGPVPIVPKVSFVVPFTVAGKDAKFRVDGDVSLDKVAFIFIPTLDFGLQVGGFIPHHLDSFRLIFDGLARTKVTAHVNISANLGAIVQQAELTDKDREDLAQKMLDAIAKTKASAPRVETPDLLRFEIVGPPAGPVPTTFEFSMRLVCSLGLKGSISVRKSAGMEGSLKAGITYQDGVGWSPVGSANYVTSSEPAMIDQVAGEVAFSCGLKPKVSWKLAGAIGPYVALDGGYKISLSYKETCPPPAAVTQKPSAGLLLQHALYLKGSAGGNVKVLGYQIADVERVLLDLSFPLVEAKWDLGTARVLGACSAAAHCRPGTARLILEGYNAGTVFGGGTPLAFDTRRHQYCLTTIATYHFGKGPPPGTITLVDAKQAKVGGSPWQSTSQGFNWVVDIPANAPPVVLNGVYTVIDSDPSTWSQNADSGGKGFVRIWASDYTP